MLIKRDNENRAPQQHVTTMGLAFCFEFTIL